MNERFTYLKFIEIYASLKKNATEHKNNSFDKVIRETNNNNFIWNSYWRCKKGIRGFRAGCVCMLKKIQFYGVTKSATFIFLIFTILLFIIIAPF